MDLKLNGQRALVLAASRGLGFATAMGLAREGTALVICSRDAARIGEAAQKIRAATGVRVEPVTADVSSTSERLSTYTTLADAGSAKARIQLVPASRTYRLTRALVSTKATATSGDPQRASPTAAGRERKPALDTP